MQKFILIIGLVGIAILLATATSRSQSADEPPAAGDSPPETITGTPSTPFAGATMADHKDPFAPYDPGPAESLWSVNHLNAAERAVTDRGLAEDYSAINAAYVSAAQASSNRARAEAAATQLGIDNLGTMGVP